jgi:hypothetical protein
MTAQRKAGFVVKIRVSPKDCLACIDVANQAGYNPHPMSFAQVVSSTLSVLLESLRRSNIIPDRDGFEYASMMAPWALDVKADRVRKLAITNALQLTDRPAMSAIAQSPEKGRKRIRFEELAFKANHDEANMSPEEQGELQALVLELNPL